MVLKKRTTDLQVLRSSDALQAVLRMTKVINDGSRSCEKRSHVFRQRESGDPVGRQSTSGV